MNLRENLPGACWLASLAFFACYFLYEGLEARPRKERPVPEAAGRAAQHMSRILSVRPGEGGEVLIQYQDRLGVVVTWVVTPEEAAQHVRRLEESPDLASFVREFGDSPLVADAPLDQPEELQAWARRRIGEIDRASAADYPTWFRNPLVQGFGRFGLLPEYASSAPAP